MNSLISGALAGFAATVPMTVAMEGMYKLLPPRQQYPLPPRLITENVADAAGIDDALDEKETTSLTFFNHFAYGAATGALYSAAVCRFSKPTVLNGIGFGLGIWLVSYEAALPLAGILSPAHEHPPQRNALMIAAHVVWGASLGMILSSLTNGKPEKQLNI